MVLVVLLVNKRHKQLHKKAHLETQLLHSVVQHQRSEVLHRVQDLVAVVDLHLAKQTQLQQHHLPHHLEADFHRMFCHCLKVLINT